MKHLFTGVALVGIVAAATASTAVTAHGATTSQGPARDRASLVSAARAGADQTGRALGLGAGETATVVKDVVADRDGSTHVRYDRTFGGCVRWVALRRPRGQGRGDPQRHVERVRQGRRRLDDAGAQCLGRGIPRGQAAPAGLRDAKAPTSELVVWAGGASPVLAYDVVTEGIRADQTPSKRHTVVDATSGATLTSWDDVKEGHRQGASSSARWTIGTTLSGSSYQMRDAQGNYATDLRNATSGNGTTFTDADDVWGSGANSDRASAGVDAHYGSEKTYEFYNTVLGRAGIYNNGTGVRSRVHYGNGYVNAFWDGTQMTYGDGAGNSTPLVELDVAGHEMSHGVTENTAGLNYSGDAGGLNEATSDIFGTSVEWFANNPSDTPDYLIGEEIDINGNGTPLRYMDKPSKDGGSKDCWSSSVGGLDPHYSSGPLNHWFYLPPRARAPRRSTASATTARRATAPR